MGIVYQNIRVFDRLSLRRISFDETNNFSRQVMINNSIKLHDSVVVLRLKKLEDSTNYIAPSSRSRPSNTPSNVPSSAPTSTYHSAPTVHVLPRSAYFDLYHKPTNSCKNATIILVAISKTALHNHLVTGCESEEYKSTELKVEIFIQYDRWIHKHFPLLTHDEARVTCCNMPVQNGSTTFILYRDEMGHERKAETERALYIPPGRPHFNENNQQKPSIVVCVTIFGKPPWFREWLLYQKSIGVDHIYLYIIEKSLNMTEGKSILQQYIDSNYATLDVWKMYLNESQVYYNQQVLLYQDCVHRHRNTFDYALLYDTDDFFVPTVPGETNIHYYVQKIFNYRTTIGSAMFTWSLHNPDCGLTQDPSTIKDGNITRYLVTYNHWDEYYKALHKLSAVKDIGIHEPMALYSGYIKQKVPKSLGYVAHIRKNSFERHNIEC